VGIVKAEFSTNLRLKKINRDNFEKKHMKKHCRKKNHVEKYCNNPRYFFKKTTKQNRQIPF
jgi:hypothetical protein